MTEKGVRFKWTEDCSTAFFQPKSKLITAPILAHPDFSISFILDVDACDQSIGAVISQKIDGEEHAIAYASRTLSKTERQYCVTRKELLALVTFVKHFKHYLYGQKFLVRTDHSSLKWLMNFKNPEGQTACWIEVLSSYDMKVEHRPGRLHSNADGVSRIPCNQCSKSDRDSGHVLNAVGPSDPVRKYEVHDAGIINWQAIVPQTQRRLVLRLSHDVPSSGHLGIRKTLSKVRQNYYWPGLEQDVKIYVTGCDTCQKAKEPIPTKRAPMQVARSGYPMERIAVDMLGELPVTERGNKYVLVVSDYLTKWTESYPMGNMEAATVAKLLVEQLFSRFGIPDQIHSDQGRQFESKLFAEMCELLHIDKTKKTPYHPQLDGMVERFNKTLCSMIRAHINENHSNWDLLLPYVTMAYRVTEHETTGTSPNMLMFGHNTRTP